jgi:predicted AlkP superfamily phosphohydrolase/phosphomutase
MNSGRKKRVLVIGLDGATFDLIEPWVAQGLLPNIARLMDEGSYGKLESTIQPTTAPAWTSFMTGKYQGKHGLYDFFRRKSDSYSIEITNSSHIKSLTIFELASIFNKHVISLNVPYTFPPRPVNGIQISGPFVTDISKEAIYPSEYYDTLVNLIPDYFIFPDYDTRQPDPLKDYSGKLLKEIEVRERLAISLMQNEPWDLFALVVMATDEAQHAFWASQAAPENSPLAPYRHVIRDIYQRADEMIGALVEIARQGNEDVVTVVLSDHGAGSLRYIINLNRWLHQAGFLNYQAEKRPIIQSITGIVKRAAKSYHHYTPPAWRAAIRKTLGADRFSRIKGEVESTLLSMPINWEQTRVYCLGAGGNLFINLKGREPHGIVNPGSEYEELCQQVSDQLQTLCDPITGEPIVRKVFKREDLYKGANLNDAPDLIIQWTDYAYWGRGRYDSKAPLFEAHNRFDLIEVPLNGTHRPEGILIIHGDGILAGNKIDGGRIVDLAPTILGILDLPIPSEMDGEILRQLFNNQELERILQATTQIEQSIKWSNYEFDPKDAEAITERLRSLGYL